MGAFICMVRLRACLLAVKGLPHHRVRKAGRRRILQEKDSKGGRMYRNDFLDSLFELADVWTDRIDIVGPLLAARR